MDNIAKALKNISPTNIRQPTTPLPTQLKKPECDKCQDSGWLSQNEDDIYSSNFGKLIRCTCKTYDDLIGLQKILGTPINHDIMLTNVLGHNKAAQSMKNAAADFIANPVSFLTIWGTNGTGKSMTGQAIINECIKNKMASVYVTGSDAMAYIKDGIGKNFNVNDRVDKLSFLPILCLDELTQLRWTDFVSEHMETIIDRRYAGKLGTILIMDESPADKLHARVVSRMNSGTVIHNQDKDMRPLL